MVYRTLEAQTPQTAKKHIITILSVNGRKTHFFAKKFITVKFKSSVKAKLSTVTLMFKLG